MKRIAVIMLVVVLAGFAPVSAQDDDEDRPDGYLFKLTRNPAMIAAQLALALQKARDTLDGVSTITVENAGSHAETVYDSYVLVRYAEAEIAANGEARNGRNATLAKMRVKWLNSARTELRKVHEELSRQSGPNMADLVPRLNKAVELLEGFNALCC